MLRRQWKMKQNRYDDICRTVAKQKYENKKKTSKIA